MRNFFTLDFFNQKMMNDVEASFEPDDEYFEKVIPLLDQLDLKPPKYCTDFVFAFSRSYAVPDTEKNGKVDLLLN